jgi:hypothetical protein
MRRDVMDIDEMVRNKAKPSDERMVMGSGSDREGFRMKGSDIGLHYALVQQLPSDMELISD